MQACATGLQQLSGLELTVFSPSLSLYDNCFLELPAVLSRATSLFSHYLSGNPDLLLTGADVDTTLRHMAALATLALPATALPATVAAHLSEVLPQLRLILKPA